MFAKNIVYLCNYEQIERMMKSFVLFYSCVVFYLGEPLTDPLSPSKFVSCISSYAFVMSV